MKKMRIGLAWSGSEENPEVKVSSPYSVSLGVFEWSSGHFGAALSPVSEFRTEADSKQAASALPDGTLNDCENDATQASEGSVPSAPPSKRPRRGLTRSPFHPPTPRAPRRSLRLAPNKRPSPRPPLGRPPARRGRRGRTRLPSRPVVLPQHRKAAFGVC